MAIDVNTTRMIDMNSLPRWHEHNSHEVMNILLQWHDHTAVSLVAGVGGQVDFIRGAALGLDGLGKPILAMQSQTHKGSSKIVPFLKQGK